MIAGLGGDDVISGLDGRDTVCGSSGNDTIRGQAGDDVARGGGGTTACVAAAATIASVAAPTTTPSAAAPATTRLTGGRGADRCRGGAGERHRARLRALATSQRRPGPRTRWDTASMSQQDVEIVKQMTSAFDRGDYETAAALIDEEVEWHVGRILGPEMGVKPVYRGIDGRFRLLQGVEQFLG